MATIAEMIAASGLQSSQSAPDLTGNIAKGAELAQTMQNMQVQREQLEQQKQAMQMQKANSITDTMKIAAEAKDPRLKKYLMTKVVPAKVNALGMNEFFTPQTLEMLQVSDEAMKKVLGLQLDLDEKIRSGVMTGAQAYAEAQRILSDPEELALLDTDQLFDAQKFKNSEEGKSARATQVANASLGKQIQGQQTAGEVELAKQTAKAFSEYVNEGGAAVVKTNYKNLTDALGDLESGSIKTGKGFVKWVGGSDFAVDITASEVASARDKIRTAIVGTLRPLLGGAFAEKEGQRILDLSFNPRMKAGENAKRVQAELRKIQQLVINKERQFVRQGFMAPEEMTFRPKQKQEK